jgi:small subunit ribosomal protein S1
VLIEKLEDKEGMVVLSKEKAEFKKNWDKILTICNEGGTITGKVKAIVKGGLLVNIGVEAFLPASQIDVIRLEEPGRSSSATVTNSRSSRSTRSARTSCCPAAN